MNIKALKKPKKRFECRYLSTLKIKGYGEDNLYPQTAVDIISSSGAGAPCLNRYRRFIEGNGFLDRTFAQQIVNRNGDTTDDICKLVCEDIARYNGFALHVNYNVLGQIVELQHEPFENCRLEEEDDNGYIANIVVHPDWSGKKTRAGKAIKVNEENIERISVFNPRQEVVQAQIQKAGGIEFYKGQILWVSGGGKYTYPIPKYDSVLPELSTDEGLTTVKYRNCRSNFLPSAMVVTKSSQGGPGNYDEVLAEFQGDENSLSLLSVTVEFDEEIPQIKEFPIKNFDKDFTVTEQSTKEAIYTAFEQEPWLCIKNGKVGFSGTILKDAYDYYSSVTNSERRMVERAIERVFSHWSEEINKTGDYSIEPLKFSSSEGTINQ